MVIQRNRWYITASKSNYFGFSMMYVGRGVQMGEGGWEWKGHTIVYRNKKMEIHSIDIAL